MSPEPGQLRLIETLIAEGMTSVLDFLSRIQRGIDEGNWRYAHDKTSEFAAAADRLTRVFDLAMCERRRAHQPRASMVNAAIAQDVRHYRAGRALYPQQRTDSTATSRETLRRVAREIQATPPPGVTLGEAVRIAIILRAYAMVQSDADQPPRTASSGGPA